MELVLTALAIFVGCFFATVSGFGFALISTPLVSMVLSPKEAIILIPLLTVLLRIITMYQCRKDFDWHILLYISLGWVVGVLPGSYVLRAISVTHLQIFLGGSEQSTLKDLNATLGKETIDMYNTGESRGQSASYNTNYQKLGKDLMSIDELAVMDGSKCIVQLRGVRPFLSDKYDLTKHPNFGLTADADKKNWFDIRKFLDHNLILNPDDEYEVIDMDED